LAFDLLLTAEIFSQRSDCDALRKELQQANEEEKLNAIANMNKLKVEEANALNAYWQAKANELQEKVSNSYI
jgi:CRISPR/Cas system-associated endonuclease Cas1